MPPERNTVPPLRTFKLKPRRVLDTSALVFGLCGLQNVEISARIHLNSFKFNLFQRLKPGSRP